MNGDTGQRLTLAVPGGLAGQIFAVGYGAWISTRLNQRVHLQFHDVGTSIAKFGVAELCETPMAKNLGITYSQVSGGWPPSNAFISLNGMGSRVSSKLKSTLVGGVTQAMLRGGALELERRRRGTNVNTNRFIDGIITKQRLESAKAGSTVVGYPSDLQIIEDSWIELSQIIRESGLPDFSSQTATEDSIAIHWRLGDYVGNHTHGAVDWSSLNNCIKSLHETRLRLKIFTDSPDLAEKIIKHDRKSVDYEIISGKIWSDLQEMTRSRTFIGTNSGVSFLAALAMVQDNDGARIWLPNQWFLNREMESLYDLPIRVTQRTFFYPVNLSTKDLPT